MGVGRHDAVQHPEDKRHLKSSLDIALGQDSGEFCYELRCVADVTRLREITANLLFALELNSGEFRYGRRGQA